MNRVKFLHEVVNTMKEKKIWQGRLNVVACKDQTEFLRIENQFEKEVNSGETNVKTHIALDAGGRKIDHESTTQLNWNGIHPKPKFWFHGPDHCNHKFRSMFHWHHHQTSGGSLKEGLNRLSFLFSIFDKLKLDQKEDQSFVLSLNLNEFPPEFREAIHSRIKPESFGGHFGHGTHQGLWVKEIHTLENPEMALEIFATPRFEVAKVIWGLSGKQIDENAIEHQVNVNGELNFTW